MDRLDLSDPRRPRLLARPETPKVLDYVNNWSLAGDAKAGTVGDLGPESIVFVAAEESPTGTPLPLVAHEISGTVTVFEVTSNAPENAAFESLR